MAEDLWYKEAIIYELHVRCFYDSSHDGIGDFNGLTEKLDYLQDLGITVIWLLPFYPSPLRDDGYDIAEYTDVHPAYGKLSDFRTFLREAHKRNIRVIIELVINHTSDQHPWFQRARRASRDSSFHHYYVWSDSRNRYKDARIIFQDFESSNWAWDSVAERYFWHRFYSHQPDLNYDNPEIHKAIFRIINFWLKIGVDGIRLDAVPYLYEREGTSCENLPETHAFLKSLRKYVDAHFEGRMLLAEANQWPEDAAKYFGEGDECHMAFHFPVMPRLFMAIHLEDSLPIIEIIGQTPQIPSVCQWALFLRNHDELTLEMVTDVERDYMFRVYATDPHARLNLGIRRRLAPLLRNDRRKIELMNSLLFSLTGTPVIYYGDEIGMGDNIYLGDRNGVRTPMQWNDDRNAGFSRANPQSLYLPPIIDPTYHYETVNVEAQSSNPYSLLYWTKQLISLRKRFKAFSYGTTEFLTVENRKILVFFREYKEELIMVITNLSRFAQYVELDLAKYNGFSLVEIFSGQRFPNIGELPYFITLGPYGYYWFSLEKQPKETLLELFDREREKQFIEIPIRKSGERFFEPSKRTHLEHALKVYLLRRIWLKPIAILLEKARIVDQVSFLNGTQKIRLVFLEVVLITGVTKRIPFYLTYFTGGEAQKKLDTSPENVVIKFKPQKKEEGPHILFDVTMDTCISSLMMDIIHNAKRIKTDHSEIKGVMLPKIHEVPTLLTHSTENPTVYRVEDAIVFPLEKGIMRLFWQVEEGMNLDVEMRLFLTDTSFQHFLPIMGYVEYTAHEKTAIALAEEVSSIGKEFNAKNFAIVAVERFLGKIDALKRNVDDSLLTPKATFMALIEKPVPDKIVEIFADDLEMARLLGNTTAAFHTALVSKPENPDFAPVSFSLFYQRSVYQTIKRKINEGFIYLKRHKNAENKEAIEKLATYTEKIMGLCQILLHHKFKALRTRYHGNYSLEHLHYTGKEFLIADFEGDLQLSYSERKYKRSPLLDVISLYYSFELSAFEAAKKVRARALLKEDSVRAIFKLGQIWAHWMGSAFLRSYLSQIPKGSCLPENPKEIDFLLLKFLLEKAFEQIVLGELEVPLDMLLYWLPLYEDFKLS